MRYRPRPPRNWALRLYRYLSPALCRAVPVVAPFSPKLAAGAEGRRGLDERLAAAATAVRDGVWFHVTSVGEYEQARPLITALRALPHPPPVVVTHFSPSGYDFAARRPCADVHEYLPFDDPSGMDRLVRAWCPRLLVFVKFDCWPNQVLAADAHGVPLLLLAGSLQPRSGRLHPLARGMYRELFDRFRHVGVCTDEDARRFRKELGVGCPVTVTGDTRAEQVILRYEAAEAGATAHALQALGGRRLILGSTWPPDEALWLPILARLLRSHPDLRVVLTPHEPTEPRLAGLEQALHADGIRSERLSRVLVADGGAAAEIQVVLTDSIGQLAEIYRAGDLAYVGGSFTTGVHNTMEPAVAGLPVMFGPVIGNAEEAGELVRRGAGFVLQTPDEALARTTALLSDAEALSTAGHAARGVVLDQRGATERSLAVILPLLGRSPAV